MSYLAPYLIFVADATDNEKIMPEKNDKKLTGL